MDVTPLERLSDISTSSYKVHFDSQVILPLLQASLPLFWMETPGCNDPALPTKLLAVDDTFFP